jgi:hypothetical protein
MVPPRAGERDMMVVALLGLSLITAVSVDTNRLLPDSDLSHAANLSAQQKSATLRRLVRSATDCVVRTVSADGRLRHRAEADEVNTLIVDSMQSCGDPMRAMIDAHDRLYGEGSGEAFFMGPYLDQLPAAVIKWMHENRP